MDLKELLAYAKEREISLSSAIFERVSVLDDKLKIALLQEFASLFNHTNEKLLLENLKEWHPNLFED